MAGDDTRIGKAMVRCPICGEDFELGTPVCINCGTVLSKVDGDRILAFGDVTLPKDYKGNVSSTGRIVIRDDQISSR